MTTTALLLALTERTDSTGPTCLLELDDRPQILGLLEQLEGLDIADATVLATSEWQDDLATALSEAGQTAAVKGVADEAAALEGLADALEAATRSGDSLLIIQADLVTHRGALANLVQDPRIDSGVLSGTADMDGAVFSLRLDQGRIIDCESPYHRVEPGQTWFLEAVTVDPADAAVGSEACRECASLLSSPPAPWLAESARKQDALRRDPATSPGSTDALALLTTGLVRHGAELRSVPLRDLYWARPTDRGSAEAAAADRAQVDEEQVMLDGAVKAKDGFFTTFFVSPYSKHIARAAARMGLTPNQITVFSLLLGAAAAAAFAFGTLPGRIVGAVLLQLAFTFDCVDGQLARYTKNFSAFGAWLDSMFDRAKEYLVYAGLAYGAVRTGADEFIWLLAAGALAAQGIRHLLDFSYAASRTGQARELQQPPLEAVDGVSVGLPPAKEAAAPIRHANRLETTWLRWPKRIITLPIGERFVVISVTAAVWGAEVTFATLLIWGAIAALYSTAGRIMRALT